MNLSKKAQELLDFMKGCEVRTDIYESFHGVVGINSEGQVIDCGKKLDTLNTSKKVYSLWKDFVRQELG